MTEIDIGRPREKVAAFAVDPNNAMAWYKNIKAVEWDTPPPVAVGSKLRFRARLEGRSSTPSSSLAGRGRVAASVVWR